MSTLIIKSKIWNISPTKAINYKDKKFSKQKLSIENSTIIYRQQNKIIPKKVVDINISSNTSNDNTNYMVDKKDELISVSKVQDNKYIINCGNWSKDIAKLINENAAYLIYKDLTIENLLKEKQKYYVLNQGDILKLGKVYLKLLHINIFNDNQKGNQEIEDKKSEGDKDNKSIKEEIKEESEEKEDDNKKINIEEEELKDNNEDENNKEKEDKNRKVLLTYTNDDLSLIHRMEIAHKKNRQKKTNKDINRDKTNNYSFSYIPKDYKNINLYIKQISKEKNNSTLNRSFNGKIPILNANNIVKESININRPKSPKSSRIKYFKILKQLNPNNLNKTKTYPKNSGKIQTKLVKNSKLKLSSINKNDESNKPSYRSINKSGIIQYPSKICRICFIEEEDPINNPLLCPCICKGSMKYIHYLCLKNWLNLKIESEIGQQRNIFQEQPTITYNTNDISCELCKTKLPDYIRHNGKIFNVLFYKPKYDKFIVFESIRDDNNRSKFIHIIPLEKKNLMKIGRLNSCDLSLPDISISRVHCCLYVESGQLFMENNSKYGTKVLIQNNSLVMSSSFPLCIEVQNTYLKLILKRNFSLFGCCGVNTTTISKMLVYQEQNEKGFDIFCSMVIKDDDEDKEDQKEEKTELNNPNNLNNLINNEENGNSNINKSFEEDKKDEVDYSKINNGNISANNINNRNNRNKKREINEEEDIEEKSHIEISKEIYKNESVQEQEFKNLINNLNLSSKEEIINKKENDEEKEIKSIKIIKEDSEIKKHSYRTVEQGDCNNLINESEIKSRSNIYNDMNRSTQKLDKGKNDKIITNLKKEKYKNKEIVKLIKKELAKENEEIITSIIDNDKTNINNEIINQNNNKIKLNKNNIEDLLKNKIYKNNIEDQIREELNIQENDIIINNEENFNDNEEINNDNEEINNDSKYELEKVKFSQKRIINKKLKNKIAQTNSSINLKETKSEKTINNHKKETTKNLINLDQKELDLINLQHPEKINGTNESKNITVDSRLNKEITKQKKLQKNTIDLNEINELSYGKIENSCNINYSPIDTYQAIFGLSLKNTNKGSSMLAPKHKNINFLKLDLNTDNDHNINYYPSNMLKNRYTYQYEEDKKSKNNK